MPKEGLGKPGQPLAKSAGERPGNARGKALRQPLAVLQHEHFMPVPFISRVHAAVLPTFAAAGNQIELF
ncbi:hypothetical protein [Brucella endophytica]|uniref:hypothetical protein n=1 Tax=Brucella endophytica TaxID=1963359 RepID=UPI00166A5B59|nr:hypothetical protein [Brucella endophytica]